MKVDHSNRAPLVLIVWSLMISSSCQNANQVTPETSTSAASATSTDLSGNRRWTTGLWGPWSSWSECSRTCGRGVATQTRTCQQESEYLKIRRMRHSRIHGNTNFGDAKRCLGVYRRFQLCPNKPCKESVDMRREQCSAFDGKPFYGSLYKWEPFLKEGSAGAERPVADTSRCELQCRPVGQRFYATLAKVVEDGTPCGPVASGALDDNICVAGQCKPVGCDEVIGSTRKWDSCGVCGGDNSTCRPVSGLFTRPLLPVGYNLVAVVPAGAKIIRITELARSRNFLALIADDGSSVLNGNWSIGRSGLYDGVGTTFTYRRQADGGALGQIITAPGPTDRPLSLMLIYQQRNTGIEYAYSLPTRSSHEDLDVKTASTHVKVPKQRGQNSTKLPKNPKHRWKYRNKSDKKKPTVTPSAYDGSNWITGISHRGNTTREYRKTTSQADFRRRVSVEKGSLSDTSLISGHRDVLNDVDVGSANKDIHWKMIGFSDCTKSCGGGTRLAASACFSERHKAIVADQYCHGQSKPPAGHIVCNSDACPGAWTVGDWSECSTSCGEGKQVRKVTCEGEPYACTSQEAPPTARSCNLASCYQWDISDWGQCSASCGTGVRRRRIRCVSLPARDPSDFSLCTSTRPVDQESCRSSQPCTNAAPSSPPTNSRPYTSPTTALSSQVQPTVSTSSPEWLVSQWDNQECMDVDVCSDRIARRWVMCVQSNQQVSESACLTPRPPDTKACEGQRSTVGCQGEWFAGPWSKCPARGCGSSQRRLVVCLSRTSDRDRLSEVHCSGRPRPDIERKCQAECSSSQDTTWRNNWFTGTWGQCSSSCGVGMQRRSVMCPATRGPDECGPTRPEDRRPCPGDRPTCPTVIENSNCVDKNTNCHLVVQSRLCHYGYYSDICCRSCALSLT